MSTTPQTIVETVRRYMADNASNTNFSDAVLVDWLGEAMTRFSSETHCCQKVTDVTFTNNYYAYSTLASGAGVKDIVLVTKVQLNTGTRYSFLPKASINDHKDLLASTTTTPTRWWLFAKSVYIDIHPTLSDQSIGITLYYSYIPNDPSSGSMSTAIDFPDRWVPALVKYVMYCAYISQRDAGLANGAFSDYESLREQAASLSIAEAS